MIFTFYSYKGGVGRSMALANVAEYCSQSNLDVLIVDWDLEAPGIERFFFTDPESYIDHVGLIDMLLDYKKIMSDKKEIDEDFLLNLPSAKNYLLNVYPPSNSTGQISLLLAGRRSKNHFSNYTESVINFDWKDFYDNWEGEIYFDQLREQFSSIADVVLIDSRTGITEMGGVCTYQLADNIIMFCGMNDQNIDGTFNMARNFSSEELKRLRLGW